MERYVIPRNWGSPCFFSSLSSLLSLSFPEISLLAGVVVDLVSGAGFRSLCWEKATGAQKKTSSIKAARRTCKRSIIRLDPWIEDLFGIMVIPFAANAQTASRFADEWLSRNHYRMYPHSKSDLRKRD